MSERPVGVFDSGLGGASVLREALRLLPNENYIYTATAEMLLMEIKATTT
ncbi:MAG: hypothetical protein ACLTYI_07400 [Christensenellales bacterium]